MVHSMTAYGSAAGTVAGWNWDWELRAVNGRGLDVRMRLPDGLAPLEARLRRVASERIARGNLAATLRLTRGSAAEDAVDSEALRAHLDRVRAVQTAAAAIDIPLAPLSVGEALALPGVINSNAQAAAAALGEVAADGLAEGFAAALEALLAMRAREGAALAEVLGATIDRIDGSCAEAEALAPDRSAHQQRILREALARTTAAADTVDPDRLAQEVALIAVKGDVTEELERLRIHIAAARELLVANGPIGRKLDFLTQEFNREANTLCSKAQYGPLTQIGLDLKAAIDQMREQVQNVE